LPTRRTRTGCPPAPCSRYRRPSHRPPAAQNRYAWPWHPMPAPSSPCMLASPWPSSQLSPPNLTTPTKTKSNQPKSSRPLMRSAYHISHRLRRAYLSSRPLMRSAYHISYRLRRAYLSSRPLMRSAFPCRPRRAYHISYRLRRAYLFAYRRGGTSAHFFQGPGCIVSRTMLSCCRPSPPRCPAKAR